ncbi:MULTISPECIES: recombinase family protein [unclassified Pseudomonas]|uniref:recombinase family protein n=1 Tax=unclassified Pseudomonas TaxID=196821 RepID=UPI000B507CBC|nr:MULTISPECIES: recombinase family protein [unclassified Pseudomonas]TFA88281.1 putative DNA-invertase from lambdoid prophage Rac [Pseudomonas sp. URIL14HWK12:I1]SNB66315.1 putative DNA-invertase from lambdoid prophage Rac [Pseudomonas sp. LAIL14HWK12:I4]
MSRTFVYARVSTSDQTTDNQLLEVKGAGFHIEPHRVIAETISGSIQASDRPGFQKLLERMEKGDVLIVTKLDRLGRNAMDVRQTVEHLAINGIRVHCLALGGVDLTSAAGKMTMQVLGAVAEFERDLLIERTHAGIKRAKSEGKKLGRPEAVGTTKDVQKCRADGLSQSQTADKLSISLATTKRHWNKSAA